MGYGYGVGVGVAAMVMFMMSMHGMGPSAIYSSAARSVDYEKAPLRAA